MKYVMFCRKMGDDTLVFEPVLFGKNQVHSMVAKAFTRIRGNESFVPVSAGEFYWTSTGEVVCHGYSETLNLESDRKRDAKIIQHHDYGGGIFA